MSKYVGTHLNKVNVRSQKGLRSNIGKTCLEDRTNGIEIKDKHSAEYFQHIPGNTYVRCKYLQLVNDIPERKTLPTSAVAFNSNLMHADVELGAPDKPQDFNADAIKAAQVLKCKLKLEHAASLMINKRWIQGHPTGHPHCRSAYPSRTRLHHIADIKPFTQVMQETTSIHKSFQGVKILLSLNVPLGRFQSVASLGFSMRADCFKYGVVNLVPTMLLRAEMAPTTPLRECEVLIAQMRTPATISKRVKGFLFSYLSYLPTLAKRTPPAPRPAPAGPVRPHLPLPPPDLLAKPYRRQRRRRPRRTQARRAAPRRTATCGGGAFCILPPADAACFV
ncbi:hypothetical protein FB451DRAFT_1176767 [Mycena latifolia]|nr:hypothetical protein FB451DRAFT_1176767 [Mycena latifolia]